jgi:hypothetical protein
MKVGYLVHSETHAEVGIAKYPAKPVIWISPLAMPRLRFSRYGDLFRVF